MKRHLRKLFPGLVFTKLHKKEQPERITLIRIELEDTAKIHSMHFKSENVMTDPAVLKLCLFWLPDPVEDDSNEGHCTPYSAVKNVETTEADIPSLELGMTKNLKAAQKQKQAPSTSHVVTADSKNDALSDKSDQQKDKDPVVLQNSKSLTLHMLCTEWLCSCDVCWMPEAESTLTYRQTDRQSLSLAISNYKYSCGLVLLPPSNPNYKTTCAGQEFAVTFPYNCPIMSAVWV